MYRRQLDENGETITIRRTNPDAEATVRARFTQQAPVQFVGSMMQARRVAVVLAEDLEASGFPLPLQQNKDRIVWNGGTFPVGIVDATTRRVGGVLIAYEIELSGA